MQPSNSPDTAPAPGRPLTARSVMASALLGMDPPELPVAQLVRLTGLFGISENRARVALSRMVGAGEATSDGAGRYRLAGHLAARQTPPVGEPRRRHDRLRRLVVAGRRDDDRQHGRGPRRPAARARLCPARRAQGRRVDAAGQRRRTAPDSLDGGRRTDDRGPARRGPTRWTAVGPLRLGPAGQRAPGRRSMRWRPTARRRWLRGSSSRPPCSGICRPTRCSRGSCSRRTGPAPGCAKPTTIGTTATAPRCAPGAGPAESDREIGGPGQGESSPGPPNSTPASGGGRACWRCRCRRRTAGHGRWARWPSRRGRRRC